RNCQSVNTLRGAHIASRTITRTPISTPPVYATGALIGHRASPIANANPGDMNHHIIGGKNHSLKTAEVLTVIACHAQMPLGTWSCLNSSIESDRKNTP